MVYNAMFLYRIQPEIRKFFKNVIMVFGENNKHSIFFSIDFFNNIFIILFYCPQLSSGQPSNLTVYLTQQQSVQMYFCSLPFHYLS